MIKSIKIPLLFFLLLGTSTIFSNDINVYWNLGYAPAYVISLEEQVMEHSHNISLDLASDMGFRR